MNACRPLARRVYAALRRLLGGASGRFARLPSWIPHTWYAFLRKRNDAFGHGPARPRSKRERLVDGSTWLQIVSSPRAPPPAIGDELSEVDRGELERIRRVQYERLAEGVAFRPVLERLPAGAVVTARVKRVETGRQAVEESHLVVIADVAERDQIRR